jgi:hypothetical protein
MTRSIEVAAVQMDIHPAPTSERLERADELVNEAVQLGAELVVLPELFNTGYAYTKENYCRAETTEGPTLHWLKHCARRMGVHLAGSLLLRDGGEIYNAMLIVAPDGQSWRYDKSYPWAWERAYFRPNQAKGTQSAVIAETEIGRLGMMICWDTAHPELWQAYAGQIDLMVVCSSPPQGSQPIYHLANGESLRTDQLGGVMKSIYRAEYTVFHEMLGQYAAWLGVPLVNSGGSGCLDSLVPNPSGSLLALLPSAPGLARYLPKTSGMRITARMTDACQITAADGRMIARVTQEQAESIAIAEVSLPDQRTIPGGPPPSLRPPAAAYLFADTLLPALMETEYRQGVKESE